ncbi:hypothetical protein BDU57DRAFT_555842 [Ampelomyces quisqualis]|uniref:Uncharacterized protein n=1 Tax=Ampelomyces quisqualis TaxID=50730 RepID=A0A6A5QTR8_AMPQU|nr:hypothetical protein BDU57DRAFT_555842 [Ampelomyces quisqualis]
MDNVPFPFTIEIGGKPIAKADVSAQDHTQAELGQKPAVFTLANGRLQNGDWIMGRDVTENRSFLPKQVSWYKANAENERRVQSVTAKKEASHYQLIFTKGKLMADEDGLILVDLLGESNSEVKVVPRDN